MPLNASERASLIETFLRLYGEDYYTCGRTLRFMQAFTVGNINLLTETQNRVLTWQPFIDAGMDLASRQSWASELARIYNGTDTA